MSIGNSSSLISANFATAIGSTDTYINRPVSDTGSSRVVAIGANHATIKGNQATVLASKYVTSSGDWSTIIGSQGKRISSTNVEDVPGISGYVSDINSSLNASGEYATIIGSNSTAKDKLTVAAGSHATIIGSTNSSAKGNYSVVLAGNESSADVDNALAFGANTNVTVEGGVALGANSIAKADTAGNGYGAPSTIAAADAHIWAPTAGQVSVGDADNKVTRRVTNVAAGVDPTDAVNVAQLKSAIGSVKGTTYKINTTAGSGKEVNKYEIIDEKTNQAIGTIIDTDTVNTVVGGTGVNVTTQDTDKGTQYTISVDSSALKDTVTTVKEGNGIKVTEDIDDKGNKEYTISVDTSAIKDTDTKYNVGIAYDPNDTEQTGEGASVVLNGTDNTSQTVLKAGEGVTISQNEKGENVINVTVSAEDIGQAIVDAGTNYKGDVVKPGTTDDVVGVKIGEVLNITGGATEFVDKKNIAVVTDASNQTLELKLAKDIDLGKDGSLTIGNTVVNDKGLTIQGGPSVTDKGIDAGNKVISGVADGVKDDDAVNVGQLNKVEAGIKDKINESVTEVSNMINEGVTNINNRINKLDGRINKVGARAAALAALHPLDFDPDDKLTFAAGYGNYKGENAAAIGAFYRPDEKVMFSVSGTVSNDDNMINAGVSFSLDRTPRQTTSKTAMAREILELRSQVNELKNLVYKLANVNADAKMFPDVPENHWAYEYIEGLQKAGILEGYPDGNFSGDRTCTRYEFAAMLFRAIQNGQVIPTALANEFKAELGRIRVDRISGADNDYHKIERVRVNAQKAEGRDAYGSKMVK